MSGAGSWSGGRLNSVSVLILSGARLVAITCSAGHRATSAADLFGDIDHLLEVVEHDQHPAPSDYRAERIERRTPVRLGDFERNANGR